jgi:thiol-disulfide isomerase/thioredoxin
MKKLFIIFCLITFKPLIAKDNQVFVTTTLTGQKFDLKEKLGKVVIINFWASWCLNCRAEMLLLEEIYNSYKSQGLEVIGVSIDEKRDYKKTLQIAEKFSYANSMLYDAKSDIKEPNSIPTSYIIDKKGNVVAKIVGYDDITKEEFNKVLKVLF